MSLALDTSKWSQTLWRSHLAHSQAARMLVAAGEAKQPDFAGLADDLHGCLYLHNTPQALPDAPQWALDLLQQAQDLAEWKPLKARCMQSGFQAGIATQTVLRALIALTPQGTGDTEDGPGESFQIPGRGQEGGGSGDTRRALRQALREAGTTVDDAERAMEGLDEALGLHAGNQPGQEDTLVQLEQVRALYEQVAQHDLLKQIAQMAGRLQRLAHSTKRSKGQSRVGSITGITVGGDLPRLLPEELAGLRGSRLQRLQVLGKIVGHRALQYDVHGEVPEARGPMLVLLDESGSMRTPMRRLLWSKAVALALLALCREQGRTWGCVTFKTQVSREVVADGGQVRDQEALMQMLLHVPHHRDGTAFDPPLTRALELLAVHPELKKADLLLITDGEADVSPEVLAALHARIQEEGLSLYAIGIGEDATLTTLKTLATECYQLTSDPQASEGTIAPMLASVA